MDKDTIAREFADALSAYRAGGYSTPDRIRLAKAALAFGDALPELAKDEPKPAS